MTCGILPVVDKQLLHAEALLHGKLAALTDNPHYRLLRQFAQWFQLPRLRRRARRGPVSDAGRHYISTPLEQAERFLSWLDQHGRGLGGCTQADLDLWHADVLDHCKKALRPFLIWAMNAGHMPKLTLPALGTSAGQPITQSRRLALLRRVLTDDRPPIRSRVAAALMLLYGQPATRLVRLTVEDVITDGDQVLIRLGTPPSPVPEPLGGLLLKLVGSRQNMNTVNAGSCWLFPGRLAGQPLHHSTLLGHLRDDLGLPTGATRAATLRQLVLQAPAPVIADALGFSTHHMNRIWTAAGGSWKSYAPGDHSR
ncbi:hypothetical protein OH799_29585 [Nocardia sp. NBC_00881]|uniref:hypothetical protein n=1 Tax=Nocardia sp. NBC_00881 TaxID=2975995 RepID=UPI00386AC14B|nr:hypothetical protein OH799_29585 [Nocardia sp. NBC_00881]